ncbi:MAG TPA: hypothetical protein VE931_07560 [Pyrinomonadaceae bacterium]|nr:hypothetical protein [Pyrinomonadaceae bacterium]
MTETIYSILAIILFGGLIIWELSIRFRVLKLVYKLFRKLNR